VKNFLLWLGAFAENSVTGKPSSKRVVLLMAGTSLSVGAGALLLAKAWWVHAHGGDIGAELLAVGGPLCALAGASYWAGRKIERDSEDGGNGQPPAV